MCNLKRLSVAFCLALCLTILNGCSNDSSVEVDTKEESKEIYENQEELNISFAEQYYERLVLTEGWADEHIETKILTTEDQGASTVCLPPEKGELGIIFKDIADFDKNGIDDLFVVMLSEYEGEVILDQSVYFFDTEGNYNVTSKSNDNPITGNCIFGFYKVGNYVVNIYKEDSSGDWIDGLRYEVIDNNVQMHDDEIHIMNYDLNASNNGESNGEILYIHKDYRCPDSVCYTIDDVEGYYAVYNRGFSLSSANDRCFESELEACDYINSLLSDILSKKVGKIEPTSWADRWNTDFFPNDVLPESYTILKISANSSYKTGENTTESDIIIEKEYINNVDIVSPYYVTVVHDIEKNNIEKDENLSMTEWYPLEGLSKTMLETENAEALVDGVPVSLDAINFGLSWLNNMKKVTRLRVTSGKDKTVSIKYGESIELDLSGKKTSLSSLLVNRLYAVSPSIVFTANKKADEYIRNWFGLEGDGTYSMELDFGKVQVGDYGYYIMIEDGEVYQVPIIHPNTSFKVYYTKDKKTQYIFDAADVLRGTRIKFSDSEKEKVLQQLNNSGYIFQ